MGKVAKNLIERCHKELEFGDFGAASIKSVIGALREYMTPNCGCQFDLLPAYDISHSQSREFKDPSSSRGGGSFSSTWVKP